MSVAQDVLARDLAARPANDCLTALPPAAFALLKPHLTELTIAAGAILWEAGRPATHVFFPVTGFVSVLLPMPDGTSVEVGSAGRQAMAGPLQDSEPNEAVTIGQVQIGGQFVRIATTELLAAAEADNDIARLLSVARDWMLQQARQLVACTALHGADQRFCRWLWRCHQAMQTTMLPLTQEQMAGLLGIRRTTVSFIAQSVHNSGVIDYRRGKITIVDPERLKAAACECCRRLDQATWPSVRMALPPPRSQGAIIG